MNNNSNNSSTNPDYGFITSQTGPDNGRSNKRTWLFVAVAIFMTLLLVILITGLVFKSTQEANDGQRVQTLAVTPEQVVAGFHKSLTENVDSATAALYAGESLSSGQLLARRFSDIRANIDLDTCQADSTKIVSSRFLYYKCTTKDKQPTLLAYEVVDEGGVYKVISIKNYIGVDDVEN